MKIKNNEKLNKLNVYLNQKKIFIDEMIKY